MTHSTVLVTSAANTGGSIYEHQIHQTVGEQYGMELVELDPRRFRFLPFKKLRYCCQLLRKPPAGCELLITNVMGALSGLLAKRCRKVLVLHHVDPANDGWASSQRYLLAWLLRHLERFERVVVVADYWKQFLLSYTDPARLTVIPNAFDTNRIQAALASLDREDFRRRLGVPLGKTLLYAGNAMQVKGADRVLQYAAELKNVYVVTSGRREQGFSNHHVYLDYEDYLRLLASSDASVLLSQLAEGWNRCAHESLLCGTPVIGRDSAGLGELLRLSGQYILEDGASLAQFRATLQEATENKERTDQARRIASRYDLEKFAGQWQQLLEPLLGEGSSQ